MKLSRRPIRVRVPGFRFAGVACGLKDGGRRDVALIVCEPDAAVAGVFTRNRFAAPPVRIARDRVRRGRIRAVLVNTKSANAGMGREGFERAREACRALAAALGVPEEAIVPCSTGKIGLPLNLARVRRGIRLGVERLSADGFSDAAEAILTTDAFVKTSVRRVRTKRGTVTVAALGKGAGMIHPDLATTLAFVTTDAGVAPARLRAILRAGVADTFNALSVDGDTSTNDTVLLLASGAGPRIAPRSADERRLAAAVADVLGDLARLIAIDGEGATRLVRVVVRGAARPVEARWAARAIANSLLVKTAFAGADPNWGRIACAAGYSGARFEPERVSVRIGGVLVARAGGPVGAAAERRAHRAMCRDRFDVEIDLGAGRATASMLTCDIGVEYVRFNSEYSS